MEIAIVTARRTRVRHKPDEDEQLTKVVLAC